ncbi:MAG: topoisomerase DNA-binding C4 zinc finger domain-containing protein [Oscillospiraceae bacterium]|nr:topoisomerase DNA-binding C4 zinc finger domain-containing protein [Oscillospiraceae bacterium]
MHAPAPDLNTCPDCGRPLREKNGRNGVFMGCSGYPECGFTRPVRR